MTAIVLAGGPATALLPLANLRPKTTLPIASAPLLQITLEVLASWGFGKVIILHNSTEALEGIKAGWADPDNGKRPEVWFIEDEGNGPAGCLRGVADLIKDNPSGVLVVSGSLLLEPEIEVPALMAAHRRSGSALTLAVAEQDSGEGSFESVETDQDGYVRQVHSIHATVDRRRRRACCGLYVLSPHALEALPKSGFVALKEQLVPALVARGLPVPAFPLSTPPLAIHTLADYWQANRHVLFRGPRTNGMSGRCVRELQVGIWVDRHAEIAPSASLHPPVFVGEGCRIGDGAQVIGPTALGSGSRVEPGATVRESLLWGRNVVGRDSRVEYSILVESSEVPSHVRVDRALLFSGDAPPPGDLAFLREERLQAPMLSSGGRVTVPPPRPSRLRQAVKRGLDVVVASVGILVTAPLWGLIALAIKLDSAGPVLFRQRRSGRMGRPFWMLKFRTMVADAEERYDELFPKKTVDGPVFKLDDDPRVTRLGGFLRRSCLDELPQLLNVLRGEMTLVGPRPLMMREMQNCPAWRDFRLRVVPGMTGLWQTAGPRRASFKSWIDYDIHYARHGSLAMDLRILAETLVTVVRGSVGR